MWRVRQFRKSETLFNYFIFTSLLVTLSGTLTLCSGKNSLPEDKNCPSLLSMCYSSNILCLSLEAYAWKTQSIETGMWTSLRFCGHHHHTVLAFWLQSSTSFSVARVNHVNSAIGVLFALAERSGGLIFLHLKCQNYCWQHLFLLPILPNSVSNMVLYD